MAAPLVGHLDPTFIETMNEVKSMLQTILRTDNDMTFVVSAPGSAGMEMCLVNLLEPGDEALICVNGVFGGRMSDIVERCGASTPLGGSRSTRKRCGQPCKRRNPNL
jgi:alanine-glyoxylate transaminase/serine-glyoxylate transaminase/serine-pyruvate transaminase